MKKQTSLAIAGPLLATVIFSLSTAQSSHANASVTLNGNTQNTYGQNYSSNGSLTIDLGVFAEYLVVGGGGGGGGASGPGGAGGGGGGGVLTGNSTLGLQSHSVVVGAGGLGGAESSNSTLRQGSNGGSSEFGALTALGGGGGGAGGTGTVGSAGASGGGGGGRNLSAGGSSTSGQGFAGSRAGSGADPNFFAGGGGGGAGGEAQPGSGGVGMFDLAPTGGNGGSGAARTITGSSVSYGGGGGGGSVDSMFRTAIRGTGSGGGGNGSSSNDVNGANGMANLGGGGGGAGGNATGGNGGSGTVIIRYLGSQAASGGAVASGTGSAAGYTIHSFNSAGTSALDFTAYDQSQLQATVNGNISGSGDLVFNGPGTLSLNASNSLTGQTRIANGTLSLKKTNALAFSTLNMSASDSGTLALGVAGNNTYTIGGLAGSRNIAAGGNTLSVGSNNATTTYSGGLSGNGGLAKTGTGTLTLSGTSTYSGATTVAAGQLTVDGELASTATVQSGARIGGSGRVGGLILDSGATLAPGNSPGTFAVSGDATWNSGANYNWQVYSTNTNAAVQTGAGTGWDFLDVGGTLTLGLDTSNRFNLNLWSLSGTGPDTNGAIPGWNPNVGSTWLLASANGGINLNGGGLSTNTDYSSYFNINTAATNGTGGWSGALTNGGFQIVTLGDTNSLYLRALVNNDPAAVPEPGQVAASLLLLAGIGGYVWMKRRKKAKAATAPAAA